MSCCCLDMLRCLAFYTLVAFVSPILLPAWILMAIILVSEKPITGAWAMAYDVLGQRWILHQFGARDDPLTDAVMRDGWPGLKFFSDLPNVNALLTYYTMIQPFKWFSQTTGYIPDFCKMDGSRSWLSTAYTTRMKYIDEAVENATMNGHVEQLVIIGAGWDFRAVDVARRCPDVTAIEVDLPGMQDVKTAACKKVKIDYDNVTLIPLALTGQSDLTELQARLDMKKKTLIVLEGVSYFLEADVVQGLVKMVGHLPQGSSMLADFAIDSGCCGLKVWLCKPGKCFFKRVVSMMGEPMTFRLPFVSSPQTSLDAFVKHTAGDDVEVADVEEIYSGVVATLRRN